jgi:hypothetical protein
MQSHKESRDKCDVVREPKTAHCEPPAKAARKPERQRACVCPETEPEVTEQPSASPEPCYLGSSPENECMPCEPQDAPVKAAPERQNPTSAQCMPPRPLSPLERMAALAGVFSVMAREMGENMARFYRKESTAPETPPQDNTTPR